MLAIKKRGMECLLGLSLLCWCGCGPPGPRALIKGERLIRQGRYEEAVESLQTATRLLPKNAQAFNHLGLALHGNRQFGPALVAYQKALALDHQLAAAHYNLGCLYLEQNDTGPAIEHLTSYTLLQPNSVEGWMRLGDAQLRGHRLEQAERAFKITLNLHPRQPEALNGLGIIQLQRRRPQEALGFFNAALAQAPGYGPALLNVAVVNQQYLNNHAAALEKYRQYLTLQPRPANWESVSALASRLDAELNPAPVVHAAPASPAPAAALKTNPVPAVAVVAPRSVSNRPTAPVASVTPKSNPAPPLAVAPKVFPQTNAVNTNPFVIASIKNPPVETSKPAPPTVVKTPDVRPTPIKAPEERVAEPPPADLEVTRLPEELVVKPPQDIAPTRAAAPALPSTVEKPGVVATNPAPLLVEKLEPKPDKRSLFSRLNPFGGKPKTTTKDKAPAPAPEVTKPGVVLVAEPITNVVAIAPTPVVPPPPAFPRYTYLTPSKPVPGNRREAEKFFSEGIRAQQAGRQAQALSAYQQAIQLDPAYFEAYYNQGLAAYGLGNWKEALADYEYALAIKPTSVDARYNFALALQQANYPRDAADELLEILNEAPSETRAHLSLANLYARQLSQPKLARQHYLKVIEEEPRHPKAAEIRYWLAANP